MNKIKYALRFFKREITFEDLMCETFGRIWYVFRPLEKDQRWAEISYIKAVICRIKNHPNGEIYYNPGGNEPDGHCKDCYELIG